MKKKQKTVRWIAGLMILFLMGTLMVGFGFLMPVTARAAGNTVIDGTASTGSLKIIRTDNTPERTPLGGAKYSIYRIMSLTPGTAPGEFASYEKEDAFRDVLQGVEPDQLLGEYSAEELDALAVELEAASVNARPEQTGTTAEGTGICEFSDLPLGYYLVVEKKAPAGYIAGSPFLVAIPSADNYETGAEGTQWVYDVEVMPKSGEISIHKKLADTVDGSMAAGDFVQYVVTAEIPDYTDNYESPVFEIRDIMSDGLEVQNDGTHGITVKVGDTSITASDTTYTVTAENKTGNEADLVISFQNAYIKANTGSHVEVTYYAKVTDQAVMGTAGNSNKAVLVYNSKPGTEATAESSEVKVFSFGIQVEKYTGANQALNGAEFELYEDAALTRQIGVAKTTDETGILNFERLDEGVYYLKETKAPAGYTLLTNPVKIEITASKTNGIASGGHTLKVNDKDILETQGIFVTRLDSTSGISTVAVKNQKGFSLPATGGRGILLFLFVGMSGIAAVTVGVIRQSGKKR